MLSLLRTVVSMEKLVQRQTKALDYFFFLKLRKPLLNYTKHGKVHFPKHTQNVTYLVSFPSILANTFLVHGTGIQRTGTRWAFPECQQWGLPNPVFPFWASFRFNFTLLKTVLTF